MKNIRTCYEKAPPFPATDQHPDARRYSVDVGDRTLIVDAVGYSDEDPPTAAEVAAVLSGSVT